MSNITNLVSHWSCRLEFVLQFQTGIKSVILQIYWSIELKEATFLSGNSAIVNNFQMSVADAMEDLEVISCSETSECSILDSTEPSSDLKDLKFPDDVDSWDELPQLIGLRTKLRTEMNNTETQALTLEQKICENRVSKEKPLCVSCGLVEEPRQRKIADLRLMHQTMIKNKPKHLLCTAGIITRLEAMILKGFLDFYCGFASNVSRCRQCRQEINDVTTKSYLITEFIDILEEQRNKCIVTENCSMNEACTACLKFMLIQLKNPDLLKAQEAKIENEETESKNESPPILFQNVLAQKLESFTAEFTKHQETQKELVSEMSEVKENLQECATTETLCNELAKYQEVQLEQVNEINDMHNQINGLQINLETMHSDLINQNDAQVSCSAAVLRMQTDIANLSKEQKNFVTKAKKQNEVIGHFGPLVQERIVRGQPMYQT